MGLFSRGNGGRVSEEQVLRALRTVQEPELGGDLVSRNMIKNVVIDGERVAFTVELTTPACPVKDQMRDQARAGPISSTARTKNTWASSDGNSPT